ncbi:MAG: S8 family serine peptidase [Candidatus Dormibacteria bacterium]
MGSRLIPAWSEVFSAHREPIAEVLPIDREWAIGGSSGKGVRVAVVDSGVDADHPLVAGVEGGAVVHFDPEADPQVWVEEGPHQDLFGHGTACAGIIRSVAPQCELLSVRVLGRHLSGKTPSIIAGVRWALAHGANVINLSLSSGRVDLIRSWQAVAEQGYFEGTTLVCAANNLPGRTIPAEFASVVSVACLPGADPLSVSYNPHPPMEFGARGIDVEVAWLRGEVITSSGNSFAAAHVSGLAALILGKHPGCTPFQLKAILHALAQHSEAKVATPN